MTRCRKKISNLNFAFFTKNLIYFYLKPVEYYKHSLYFANINYLIMVLNKYLNKTIAVRR